MSREEARKQIVEDLDSDNLIHEIEDHVNKVGYSERGHDYVDSIRSIMRENALGLFDSGKLWRPELMDLRGPGA